jgi:hypothetical protein
VLYAELHGKLSSDIGDGAERLEDVLTSTVFGTLFAAGAWDVVSEWLSRACREDSDGLAIDARHGPIDYWFWPCLDNAEPDLVLRFGTTLVVIEAKYLSGKSGSCTPSCDVVPNDQLVREWRAIGAAADSSGYDPRLRDLVADPATRRVLIYLVRRNRYAHEVAELEHSLAQAPGANMYLLTWEHLDGVLATRVEVRWASELRRYLERRRVTAFRGFGHAFTGAPSKGLHVWKLQRTRVSPSFVDVMPRQPAISLLARRLSMFAPERGGWSRAVRVETAPLLHQLANRPTRFPEH